VIFRIHTGEILPANNMVKAMIFAILSFIGISNLSLSQIVEPQTHLFLGTWHFEKNKTDFYERWTISDDSTYSGSAYKIKEGQRTELENTRIVRTNNKWYYCALVEGQNGNKEIEFELTGYDNEKQTFKFENTAHDFPKIIFYYFGIYNGCEASVCDEKDTLKIKYEKVYPSEDIYTLIATIVKEPFINKVGREIIDIFDYYLNIQKTKYFIKFSAGKVTKQEIEKYLDKEIKCTFRLNNGLWDTNDNRYQSRIGNYAEVLSIKDN
jgi:hypothetical protein